MSTFPVLSIVTFLPLIGAAIIFLPYLGFSYLGQGDERRADRCLRQVVEREAGNQDAWEGLAEVHRRSGDMEEAVLCWRRAGHQGIDRRSAWVRSADLLLDGHDEAGVLYRDALGGVIPHGVPDAYLEEMEAPIEWLPQS